MEQKYLEDIEPNPEWLNKMVLSYEDIKRIEVDEERPENEDEDEEVK